jgi:transcriptional regulator of NAD metabolism
MESGWFKLARSENCEEFNHRSDEIVSWLHDLQKVSVKDRVIGETKGVDTVILVIHGNLMSAIINRLMRSNQIIVHKNTAYSHVQLVTAPAGKHVTALKFLNRADHLSAPGDVHLQTGDDIIRDSWLHEFLQGEYM